MTVLKEVHDQIYDLTSEKDLAEIEDMCKRPDKYIFSVDETIYLPFTRLRFETITSGGNREVHDRVYDLSSSRDLSEIERMFQRPDKYKILKDETLSLPFRHVRYEVVRKQEEQAGKKEN